MDTKSMLVIFLVLVLVKCDYFSDYFEKWLMREKMECVFDEYDVAEDVLTHVPENMLQVQIADTRVTPGEKFSPPSLLSPPNVTWDCEDHHVKQGAEIAVVMVGADPGNQTLTWLIDNITGCDISTGQEVCKYRPPSPSDARAHLYIICQFMRQPSYDKRMTKINPRHFSMVGFAMRGGYGDPYACNFIVLQNDNDMLTADRQNRLDSQACNVFGDMYLLT